MSDIDQSHPSYLTISSFRSSIYLSHLDIFFFLPILTMSLGNSGATKRAQIWTQDDGDGPITLSTTWKHVREYRWSFDRRDLDNNVGAFPPANVVLDDWTTAMVYLAGVPLQERFRRWSLNFAFKGHVNHNFPGVGRAYKLQVEGTYYYGVYQNVELHGAEGTRAGLPRRPSIGVDGHRGSVCLIQNDDPPVDEDLRAAFEAAEKGIKAKRSKTRSRPVREHEPGSESEEDTTTISSSSPPQSAKKLTKGSQPILLDFSEDEEDEPNDPKPFYVELRSLFLTLAKEVSRQCPTSDGVGPTEDWIRIAQDFNEASIKVEAKDPDGNSRNLFLDLIAPGVPPKKTSYDLYYPALGDLIDTFDELGEVIPKLYPLATNEDGVRELKRVFKIVGRRFNEISLTISRKAWKPVF